MLESPPSRVQSLNLTPAASWCPADIVFEGPAAEADRYAERSAWYTPGAEKRRLTF
jgi:hypothetical protein